MKYKILVLSRRLDIGGVEVSLCTFLENLDQDKYEVDLFLTEYEGVLKKRIPSGVTVREVDFKNRIYLQMLNFDTNISLRDKAKKKWIEYLGHKRYKNTGNPYLYTILDGIKPLTKKYDLAIDFHGYGYITTLLMCKKVKAMRKVMFIHDEKMDWLGNIEKERDCIDYYFCVSDACANTFARIWSGERKKIRRFDNIISAKEIYAKSAESQEDIGETECPVLVSVGRLEWQKGFDIAIDVARLLMDRNIDFRWYIVGEGSLHEELAGRIRHKGLEKKLFLLGQKENPYPLIKRADIYVQTSRHEGFGIAVCEAKILKKAICASRIPCIEEQLTSGVNSTLVSPKAEAFAEAIEELIKEPERRRRYACALSGAEETEIRQMEQIELICEELGREKG